MSRTLITLFASLCLLTACKGDDHSHDGNHSHSGDHSDGGDHSHADAQGQESAPESAAAEPAPTEAAAEVTGNVFGEPITLTDAIAAKDIIANPTNYLDKEILVEGEVVDVCQKMGCWMVLSDGEKQIRVTMKGHNYGVRKDGAGSMARIQGKLQHVPSNPERTAHIESESAKPEAMPEKAGLEYEIDAAGVVFSEKS